MACYAKKWGSFPCLDVSFSKSSGALVERKWLTVIGQPEMLNQKWSTGNGKQEMVNRKQDGGSKTRWRLEVCQDGVLSLL